MRFFNIISIIGFAAASAYAKFLPRLSESQLPTRDSFYVVPDNVNTFAPGAIIRHRAPPSPIALLGADPVNLKQTLQILYRTTDSFGNATATVLTVLVPHNADYSKILSYQTAQDSASPNCAPSYGLQFAPKPVGMFGVVGSGAEILLMEAALEQGWIVITPDHEGHKGAFLANRRAGQSILDGIRAALQSGNVTGISEDATTALWGYSGGGLVSGWAAELAPTYAPELNLVGAAIGGLTPDITNVVRTVNKGIPAGLIPAGVMGLAAEYPAVSAKFFSHIKPQFSKKFQQAKEKCIVDLLVDFLFNDIVGMTDTLDVWYSDPAFTDIIKANDMGKAAPRIPLYVYKSLNDEASPVEDTDKLVKYYCDNGTPVQYIRDTLSEHGILAATGAPKALAFLVDVLNGKKQPSGCSTRTVVSSLLDPSTAKYLPGYIIQLLMSLVGGAIGPI